VAIKAKYHNEPLQQFNQNALLPSRSIAAVFGAIQYSLTDAIING
jgi:hypothetical protein